MTSSTKPVFLRISGNKEKSLELRKFADKLLQNSKHRNEVLGNYANPVTRFRDGDNKFKVSSLPGYDIVEIDTPIEKLEELLGVLEVYSGLLEVRYNPAGTFWYLRYNPAFYELYNREQFLEPGPGSSVDGQVREDGSLQEPEMPPNRWMYNDYDPNVQEEMPWFDESYLFGHVAGRFSGKLRELVQLQLGAGMEVGFSYNISASHGLKLEALSPTETRLWLVEISGTNGILMQHMYDYTESALERTLHLRKGGVPIEIRETGFYTTQTRFDYTRDIYTRSEYNALNPKPPISEVTFRLMSSEDYTSAVDEFSVLGDYGWSYNSTATKAVAVGVAFNRVDPGTPARNYKSQLFTISILPGGDFFSATIAGDGEKPFLFDSINDQIKVPDAAGLLTSIYLFRDESGNIGAQPSNSYIAPIYAYYDKNDTLQAIDYVYEGGSDGDFNGNTSDHGGWYGDCRSRTNAGATDFEYSACGYARSGNGTLGKKHGFISSVLVPDSYDYWDGWEGNWGPLTGYPGFWVNSINLVISEGFNNFVARMQFEHHYLRVREGTFGSGTWNVIVIPSWERMGYYHFKQLLISFDGKSFSTAERVYELAQPVRQSQSGAITACNNGLTQCGIKNDAELRFPSQLGYTYQATRNPPSQSNVVADPSEDCLWAGNPNGPSTHPCWVNPAPTLVHPTLPPLVDPDTETSIVASGSIQLPDGNVVIYNDGEVAGDVFAESDGDHRQGCVSAFDIFEGLYIFSQPRVGMGIIKQNVESDYFFAEITKYKTHFVGTPGADYE